METGFFRFWEKENGNPKVYSTSLISLFFSTLFFTMVVILLRHPIAEMLNYQNHPEYISWFAIIIGLDALTAIPFAYLRQKNKALRFATIRLINIAINILLNLFFLLLCPWLIKEGYALPLWLYDPAIGIGYVFISNLIASFATWFMLIPSMRIPLVFDKALWKKMLAYSAPLLIAGLAGMVNETFDRAMLKYLLPDAATAQDQLGIYGANYKVAILMTLFVQTFRFAAEPFFFSQAKEKNASETFSKVMNYFIILGIFIFLGVMLYIDLVKYFIGEEYRSGLDVVPVLLMANLFLGIFINLSIWYKISKSTMYGAYLTFFGAAITILLNLWLIPIMGYMGSAWATLICYFAMMVVSYFWGQHHFPVNYNLLKAGIYFVAGIALYFLAEWTRQDSLTITLCINTVYLIAYGILVILLEPELGLKKVLKR
jgi:O-antigen/teichoic acid export membrane protein